MYEDQTYENILDRSLARVASDVDKREGCATRYPLFQSHTFYRVD